MDTRSRRNPLRILAPVALVAFAIALVVVLSGGNGGGGGGTAADKAASARDLGPAVSKTTQRRHRTTIASGQLPQSVYIVKDGDTLGGIAQKTGVPIANLQDLNPGLDQFSLVAGQRIKLR
jgi:LysM repeat protein